MADHHLMLEEACCVPLGDVQRHGEEDTQMLPCLTLRRVDCQLEVASIVTAFLTQL